MKLKKLTTALAVMPFGIAARLAASGSAPFYGNVTTTSTRNATIDPRRHNLHRIQQSIEPPPSSSYITMSYTPPGNFRNTSPERSFFKGVITTSTSWFGTSRNRNKGSQRKRVSLGKIVEPGKVLSKEERERRRDSATALELLKASEEQKAPDPSFRARLREMISRDTLEQLDESLGDNLAPEIATSTLWETQTNAGLQFARHLIVLIILFLIVFGALSTVISHLLYVTRASAQCTPTTVISTITVQAPAVTYTHTESVFISPTACITTGSADIAAASTDTAPVSTVTDKSTSTSSRTTTTTVTVIPATPYSSSGLTSSTLPFVYNTDHGSTSWVNGVSPSSGASLTTVSTYITVTPAEQSTPSATSNKPTSTVTEAADTSSLTSFISPDLTTTVHITRTDTVPSFVTQTRTRPFSGIGSSGWNATATQEPADSGTLTTAVVLSTPTTATLSIFWASSGGHTYSSSTRTITTTLYRTIFPTVTSNVTEPATTPSTSSSITFVNGTGSITATASTSNGGSDTPSTFPSMTPGTGGISPASGTATGMSGSALSPGVSSSQTLSSDAQGVTGARTEATTAFSGNNSVSATSTFSSDNSTLSISGVGDLTDTSSTQAVTSPIGTSSTSLTQNGTSTAMSNSSPTSYYGSSVSAVSPASEITPSGNVTTSTSSGPTASSVGVADITSSSTSASINNSSAVASNTQTLSSTAPSLASSNTTTVMTPSPSSGTSGSQALPSTASTLVNGQVPSSSITPSSRTETSTVMTESGSVSASKTQGQDTASSSSSTSSALTTDLSSISSSSITATPTASNTSAFASASPTVCGEHGDFVLTFDDLPSFTGDDDITQAPPIFSPYHHLTFSNGYVHAPKSKQPFGPHSGEQLAVFLASSNGTNDTTAWHQPGMSAVAPRGEPGDITDGPYDGLPAFWFDAQGAWLGCDNAGPDPCVFNVTGSTWDSKLGDDVETYNTQIEVAPCPGFKDCKLQHVDFPKNFRGLSGIQIEAFVKNKPVMFFMDDLALGWYDNSCEAGMRRMARPGTMGGPGFSGGARKRVVRRTLMH